MKYLLFLFLVSCTVAYTPAPHSVADTARAISGVTVALEETDEEGVTYPFCSGVWVTKDYILTAAHCAKDDAIKYIIRSEVTGHLAEPKTLHLAGVAARDVKHDVAVLVAVDTPPPHPVARFGARVPDPGDVLYFTGQDRTLYWTFMVGWMSAYTDHAGATENGKEGPWLQVQAPIAGGMSGSGVFDETGGLVGIISFTTASPGLGFAQALPRLRPVLAEAGKSCTPQCK